MMPKKDLEPLSEKEEERRGFSCSSREKKKETGMRRKYVERNA